MASIAWISSLMLRTAIVVDAIVSPFFGSIVYILKEIVAALAGNGRLSFTADQRRRLAVAGKALSRAGHWYPTHQERRCVE